VSIDSIRNTRDHNHLIEEIRKKMTILERANWNIKVSWIKVHVGVGNELADQLTKATASDSNTKIVFNRLPMCTLIIKIEEETKLNSNSSTANLQTLHFKYLFNKYPY
jgi:hypothetical protein